MQRYRVNSFVRVIPADPFQAFNDGDGLTQLKRLHCRPCAARPHTNDDNIVSNTYSMALPAVHVADNFPHGDT